MTRYELQDYRKQLVYRVTPAGEGAGEQIEAGRCEDAHEAFRRSAGYAAWMRMGMFRARRVFVALFTDGKTLFFRFGDRMFDCLADRVVAVRESGGVPGVKRFRLAVNGRSEVDERYLWADWSTWPDSGDILEYVVRIVESRENMYFLILFRAAAQEGRAVGDAEVAQELRRRAEALAKRPGAHAGA